MHSHGEHGSVIHWAQLYDFATRWFGKGLRLETVEHARLRPGEKVLDVGCGPGVLTLLAKQRVGPTGEAHGVDPSPEMIAVARQKAAKARLDVQFHPGVLQELPFPDGKFDAVLSSLMLHHVPIDARSAGFREIARVLRPGGRLLAFDFTGKRSLWWRLFSLVGHKLPDTYVEDLLGMMRDAGLVPDILPTGRRQYVTILATRS